MLKNNFKGIVFHIVLSLVFFLSYIAITAITGTMDWVTAECSYAESGHGFSH
ncbi:hypothetical protein [Fusibacter bizertensis]